jgi:hypothetical protein
VDDDADAATPCVSCSNTLPAFIPAQSVGLCNATVFACPDGTFNSDNNVSTPCATTASAEQFGILLKDKSTFTSATATIFGLLMAVLGLVLLVLAAVLLRRHKRRAKLNRPHDFARDAIPQLNYLPPDPAIANSPAVTHKSSGRTLHATPRELQRSDIKQGVKIGEGAFATIFKGFVKPRGADETVVAIKVCS